MQKALKIEGIKNRNKTRETKNIKNNSWYN